MLLPAALAASCAARAPVRGDTRPFAWKANLSLTIQAPRWDLAASVPATLLVRRPDVLFLQLRGPMGGSLAETCTDRRGLSVLLPTQHRLFVEADPASAIAAATGGALVLDGLLALLVGEEPVWDVLPDGSVPLPEGRIAALHRDGQGRLTDLAVHDETGASLLEATWEGWARREGAWRPEVMELHVPPLGLRVRARYRSWEILGSVPVTCAHALPGGGPEGFSSGSLVELLEGLPPADP